MWLFELIDESVCVEGEREQGGEEVNKGMEGSVGTDVAAAVAGPVHSSHMSPDACEVRSSIMCLAVRLE